MASVTKRGDTYTVRWRTPDGKQPRKTFRRRTDANAFRALVEASLSRGEYIDVRDRTTVTEAALAWLQTRPVRPSTRANYEQTIRGHIAPTRLGGMRLNDVRASHVQAWVAERAPLMAASTLSKHYGVLTYVFKGVLTYVFKSAVRDRRIAYTPCDGIKLPRYDAPRVVTLTVAQVQELAAAMPPGLRALVILLAGTGLRHGEALGLRVQDVDFLRRTIRVEQQHSRRQRVRAEPKTPRSVRTVPLPAPVADAVAAHLAAYGPGDDDVIFHTRSGGYHHQEYVTRFMQVAVERLGLPKGTTPHDLRHHYASVLLAMGENSHAVAERLGDSVGMVDDVYRHLMPGHEERTRQAIEEAWRAQSVPNEDARTS